MHDAHSNDARIVSPRDVVTEMMGAIENDTQFQSDLLSAIKRHPKFVSTVRYFRAFPNKEWLEGALPTTIEQLEYHPWIALALLREIAPSSSEIPKQHAGNLYWLVEYWIRWAKKHGYITERSHLFFMRVRIHREVTKCTERLLTTWKSAPKHTACWHKLVQLGKQYPSVIYPIVLTKWALGYLSQGEGCALMEAISNIPSDYVATSISQAPSGVEPHDFDHDNPLSSWNEWFRRWGPIIAPYQLWSH